MHVSDQKFDLDQIRAVIRLLSESDDIAELEVESPTLKVSVKKVAGALRATATAGNPGTEAPTQTLHMTVPAPQPTAPVPAAAVDHLTPISAPMVGTFFRAPNPDAPPFVSEGDVVEPGQTVCIIEAMKLFNEIQSEMRGRVVRVLVENAAPVEFGQPLFLIDPTVTDR
ncbi:MAG: acetyl-CoA carboxylase biotin carboxyl carrier protein [Armatimonadetes bacterium]|nr:acetyl-CoA carboxylase biotin carboxyl carrier protein [Armatimonadota bacterium]MBI2972384.1 acetyl-CoA carboxylase biotin carboxyl carrier protein [Armatimonadota bacterium]